MQLRRPTLLRQPQEIGIPAPPPGPVAGHRAHEQLFTGKLAILAQAIQHLLVLALAIEGTGKQQLAGGDQVV